MQFDITREDIAAGGEVFQHFESNLVLLRLLACFKE